MTDLKGKRPAPTGAWVLVDSPALDSGQVYRWDPNATAEPLGHVFVLNRRQAFAYNIRALIRRVLERITRHD